MKIPNEVQKLIDKRCNLAEQLLDTCWKLDKWLDNNKIVCEDCDTHTGVEIYCNPYASKNRIIEAINKHDIRKVIQNEL